MTCGFVGQAGKAAYVATKHGMNGLNKSATLEYGAVCICCNAVCTSDVKMPLILAQRDNPALWTELDVRHATDNYTKPENGAPL